MWNTSFIMVPYHHITFSHLQVFSKKKKNVVTAVMLSCTCNKQSSPKQAAVRKPILCFLCSVKVRQQAHILQSSRLVQSTKYKHRYKWAFSACASTKVVKPVAVRKIHLAGICHCAYRVLKFALWSHQNDGNWMWKRENQQLKTGHDNVSVDNAWAYTTTVLYCCPLVCVQQSRDLVWSNTITFSFVPL